jgi:hypothetical protein
MLPHNSFKGSKMEIRDYPAFDVTTAKGGETVNYLHSDGYLVGRFVGISKYYPSFAIIETTDDGISRVPNCKVKQFPIFKMPDNVPVFVGGKVFHKINKKWFTVVDSLDNNHIYGCENGSTKTEVLGIGNLLLDKPKETKTAWVNVYKDSRLGCVKLTKEDADRVADHDRIDCVKLTWEE